MRKLFGFLFIILLLIGCNDTIKPKEEELQQYPWMEIFTPGRSDFEGIHHNIDIGKYSFSFKTSYSSIDIFFIITDSNAVNNNWEIIQKTADSRLYRKKSTIYDAAEWFDFVNLTYMEDNNSIIFKSVANSPTYIE